MNHAHPAELLHSAIVTDDLANHWRESYVSETGKSMKPVELVIAQEGCWRKIAIALIDEQSKRVICFRQLKNGTVTVSNCNSA
jgi:hypothetical protein